MKISMEDLKALREESGAGVMDAKKALEESGGDMAKAREWIAKRGLAKAEKKADREATNGIVYAYVHHNQLSGAMVEVACETDFVAKTDDFVELAKNLAMQVTSSNPKDLESFLKEDYLRDPSMKIEGLVKSYSGKLGEKIELKKFERMVVGE